MTRQSSGAWEGRRSAGGGTSNPEGRLREGRGSHACRGSLVVRRSAKRGISGDGDQKGTGPVLLLPAQAPGGLLGPEPEPQSPEALSPSRILGDNGRRGGRKVGERRTGAPKGQLGEGWASHVQGCPLTVRSARMGEDLQGTGELEGSQPAFSTPAWVLASLLGSGAKPLPSSNTEPKLPPLHLPRKDLFPCTGVLSLGTPPRQDPALHSKPASTQLPANSRAECLNPNNSKTGTRLHPSKK